MINEFIFWQKTYKINENTITVQSIQTSNDYRQTNGQTVESKKKII